MTESQPAGHFEPGVMGRGPFMRVMFTAEQIARRIISEARAATYYVDATNGKDVNNGLSQATPGKPSLKSMLQDLTPESGGKKIEPSQYWPLFQ